MIVALLLAGCGKQRATQSHGGDAPPAQDTPSSTPDPALPPDDRPEREPMSTHLLVIQHTNSSRTAVTIPVVLSDSELRPLEPRSWTALPMPNWPDHFTFVAAHEGGRHYAVARQAQGGHELVWATIAEPAADRAVAIGPTAPASLLVAGTNVIAGIANELGQVDFGDDPPAYRSFHKRPEMKWKAYDLFARANDWVIAIDDVVTPVYADGLRLNAEGHAAHELGFELPGAINGVYRHAALHRTGPAAGTLYAIVPYGVMDGNGQDLARLPIEAGRTTFGSDLTINSTAHPNVLEEHVDRGTGKPTALAAGKEFSPWTGLALLEGPAGLRHVLLAAGPRGLLVLPAQTGPKSKAEVVTLGANCHDVLTRGPRIFALVEGAIIELAERAERAGPNERFEERRRVPIPAGLSRWAR